MEKSNQISHISHSNNASVNSNIDRPIIRREEQKIVIVPSDPLFPIIQRQQWPWWG